MHKKVGRAQRAKHLVEKLKKSDDWYQIYKHEEITTAAVHVYQNIRSVFDDLQVVKMMNVSAIERRVAYL